MTQKLYIPVGLPGCGKSSFAANMGFNVVSTDAIRASMSDVTDQTNNDKVFEYYHGQIEMWLKLGLPNATVYADATNLKDFARHKLTDIAQRVGAETHVFLFTNTHQAVINNSKRERRVPDNVMVRFITYFEKVLRDLPKETYTSITHIESTQGVSSDATFF